MATWVVNATSDGDHVASDGGSTSNFTTSARPADSAGGIRRPTRPLPNRPATNPRIADTAIARVRRDDRRPDDAGVAVAIEEVDGVDAREIQLSSRLTSPALCQRSSGSLSRQRSTR